MNIAINGNEANVKNPVGSNVFAQKIIWAIYKLDKKNNYQVYLKNAPLDSLPKERKNWSYQVFGPKFLWTQLALSLKSLSYKPDILFSPGHYSAALTNASQVACIMDLAFLKFPQEFRQKDLIQLKLWTARSVKFASKIIAISENTKKDLINFYQVPEEKIEVIYPALVKAKEGAGLKNTPGHVLSKKYLLFIGTLQPRKNVKNLILAYQKILVDFPDYLLVIVGKKGWLYDDVFKLVKKLNLEDKIIFTGFVPDKEKTSLLKKAQCLVFPSLYEGFGFPILEAYHANCPVVCSANSSLPEVAGKAAIYIENEKNPDSIAKAIIKMLKLSKEEKNELINLGKQQLGKFSWDKAGKEIIKIFEDIKS